MRYLLAVFLFIIACSHQPVQVSVPAVVSSFDSLSVSGSGESRLITFRFSGGADIRMLGSSPKSVSLRVASDTVAPNISCFGYVDDLIAGVAAIPEKGGVAVMVRFSAAAEVQLQQNAAGAVLTVTQVLAPQKEPQTPPAVVVTPEAAPEVKPEAKPSVQRSGLPRATTLLKVEQQEAGNFLLRLNGQASFSAGELRKGVQFIDIFGVVPATGLPLPDNSSVTLLTFPARTRFFFKGEAVRTTHFGDTIFALTAGKMQPESTPCVVAVLLDKGRILLELSGPAPYTRAEEGSGFRLLFPEGLCTGNTVPEEIIPAEGAVRSVRFSQDGAETAVTFQMQAGSVVRVENTERGILVFAAQNTR